VKQKVTEAVDVSTGTSRGRLGQTGTGGGILYRVKEDCICSIGGIVSLDRLSQ
jgi:hypothetical protein